MKVAQHNTSMYDIPLSPDIYGGMEAFMEAFLKVFPECKDSFHNAKGDSYTC